MGMKQVCKLFTILSVLLFAGCDKKLETGKENGPQEIHFTASFPVDTKATATSFEEGDRIGLSVSAPVSLSREVLNYADGAITPENKLYWPIDSQKDTQADFLAWFPYSILGDQEPLGNRVQVEIPGNQYASGAYEAYDLLTATTTAKMGDGSVNLAFRHYFSRLKITVVDQMYTDTFRDVQSDSFQSLEIGGLKLGAVCFIPDGTVASFDTDEDKIYPYKASAKTYWALVVPQDARPEIVFTLDSGKSVRYTSSTSILFSQGKQVSATITLKEEDITFVCEITDWADAPENLVFKQDPPDNEIWYTTGNGSVVTPSSDTDFGAALISNTYENGKGVISFEGPISAIPSKAFRYQWYLSTLSMPNSVETVGSSAFEGSRLVEINLSNKVETIGSRAFAECSSLREIGLPNKLKTIESSAFYMCSNLSFLIIPYSVTKIESNAFHSCSLLTSITIAALIPPVIENDIFDNTGNCPIYVPDSSVEVYKRAGGYWSEYAGRIQPIVQ